jgi:hypothetical protein
MVALALTMSASQAATLIDTDFSKGSAGWVLNQDAQLLDPQTAGITQVLSLTQHLGSQTGTAWTEMSQKVDSFSFIADIRIRFSSALTEETGGDPNCPADGVVMGFAPVEADFVGGGGGSISLFSGEVETFTSMVINTWRGAGNGNDDERAVCDNGKNETFEFGVVTPSYGDFTRPQDGIVRTPDEGGSKINQVNPPSGMKLVNGGFYRYQFNVDGVNNTMAVYVTGLDESNKQFQKVKVIEAKFDAAKVKVLDFQGRWGLAAATGGAVQFTDVARARIDSPMIDPL